jgi:hypothetical protein
VAHADGDLTKNPPTPRTPALGSSWLLPGKGSEFSEGEGSGLSCWQRPLGVEGHLVLCNGNIEIKSFPRVGGLSVLIK